MSKWIRQTHRWVSIAFTLMFSGLYLFALPYATKWGSGQRTI